MFFLKLYLFMPGKNYIAKPLNKQIVHAFGWRAPAECVNYLNSSPEENI